jgi:MATE family multidrug resistance protein
MERKDSGIE